MYHLGDLNLISALKQSWMSALTQGVEFIFWVYFLFSFRGSKMVFISMLTLLSRLAVLNMYTDYFLSSSVFPYYLDLIPQGLMTTLPSIFEQLCLVSISLPSKKPFNILPLTFSKQLVSPLYYLPQLHRMQSSQFLVLFSSKEIWFGRDISNSLKCFWILSWYCYGQILWIFSNILIRNGRQTMAIFFIVAFNFSHCMRTWYYAYVVVTPNFHILSASGRYTNTDGPCK